ncbi:MAG TPA: HEPN domain-containing protein [Chloroflexi bacterium]|nr:HEPN domain-containing protein [Chloroflexota bacterium]
MLSKAKENLEASQSCLDSGFYNVCASRSYYVAFQAAIVALADKGKRSDKNSHRWVQATFSEELVRKRKVYPGKLKSYLMDMQIVRNQADYTRKQTSKKIASRQLAKAKEFVEAVEKEVN